MRCGDSVLQHVRRLKVDYWWSYAPVFIVKADASKVKFMCMWNEGLHAWACTGACEAQNPLQMQADMSMQRFGRAVLITLACAQSFHIVSINAHKSLPLRKCTFPNWNMALWVMVGKVLTWGTIVMLNKNPFGIGKFMKTGHEVQCAKHVYENFAKMDQLQALLFQWFKPHMTKPPTSKLYIFSI